MHNAQKNVQQLNYVTFLHFLHLTQPCLSKSGSSAVFYRGMIFFLGGGEGRTIFRESQMSKEVNFLFT